MPRRRDSGKSRCRVRINGNGAVIKHAVARLEPRCDGEGRRGGRHRLVEGSDECNDPEEEEGAEALTAVHHLVTVETK